MSLMICPVCRSQLFPVGHWDLKANAEQRLPCPVCGYKISLSSGFPIPTQYDYFVVTERHEVLPGVSVDDVMQRAPGLAVEPLPGTVYKDFSITEPLKNIASGAGQITGSFASSTISSLGLVGIIGIFLLFVFLMMKWRE